VPLTLTRSERFDEYVLDAVEQVERVSAQDADLLEQLGRVEFAIEEVPPEAALTAAETGTERLGLARSDPPTTDSPPRVVLYRRPVELRTPDLRDRAVLVHELVVEQLAEVLGVETDRLDPPDL
jgi:predicted Zn-dependent protease with MMP-like domain